VYKRQLQVLSLPALFLVVILLAISIVGIPLLLVVPPALGVLLVVYFVLGLAGVARCAGEWGVQRFDLRGDGPYVLLTIGLLVIYGWSILAELFAMTPWPIRISAYLLAILGFVLKYIAWTAGLGAAVLDHFSPISSGQDDHGIPTARSPTLYRSSPRAAMSSSAADATRGRTRLARRFKPAGALI